MRKRFVISFCLLLVLVGGIWIVQDNRQQADTSPVQTNKPFNKQRLSLDDPASLWVLVNKKRPLQPETYQPDDLIFPSVPLRLPGNTDEMRIRQVMVEPLKAMFRAAEKDGLTLMISSAYRSYSYQKGLYNHYVKEQGQTVADTQSARPGHSEHQTGLAVDIEPASRQCEIEACFADTLEGNWIASHAHKYGFIIRYQEGQTETTGYTYEPWHLRYVGPELAKELFNQGNPPLEIFFGLPKAPDYN